MSVLNFILEEIGLDARAVEETDPGSVALEKRPLSLMDIDSLEVISLFQALEEKYGIEIDRDEAMKLRTVLEISDYVEARLPRTSTTFAR